MSVDKHIQKAFSCKNCSHKSFINGFVFCSKDIFSREIKNDKIKQWCPKLTKAVGK